MVLLRLWRICYLSFVQIKAMTPSSIDDYTEVLIGLRRIIRSINLESKKIEKEHGASIPQILCLKFIAKEEDLKASSTQIKNFMNLNASTVTGIVNRLERKGLVAKLPNPKDKRASFIAITSKGLLLLQSIPPLMHDKLTTKLKSLPGTDLDELLKAVQLLTEFVGAEEIDASPVITLDEAIS